MNTPQTNNPSLLRKLHAILKRHQKLGTWIILLSAYSYLGFQLSNYQHYPELLLQWKQLSFVQFGWLAGVFILLPLNLSLEAVKWQQLTSKLQKISFPTALKAVLAGIYTGFFTPNRVAELLGRVRYLEPENRKPGAVLSLVNSLTQNIIMTLCGIPASLFFFSLTSNSSNPTDHYTDWMIILIILVILIILLLFSLPIVSRFFTTRPRFSKRNKFTSPLSSYNRTDLFGILTLSLLRYLVFGTQFFLMLRFFGVAIAPLHALIAIPASYLFVTYTPSIAFSEAAIRSSYAVLFIGAFSPQIVGIALAGTCIWVVNFALPLLAGSFLYSIKITHSKTALTG